MSRHAIAAGLRVNAPVTRITTDQKAGIVNLLVSKQDWTIQQIANEAGHSRTVVAGVARREGIKRRKLIDADEIQAVLEEHPDWTLSEVSRVCNVSARSVARVKKQFEVLPR